MTTAFEGMFDDVQPTPAGSVNQQKQIKQPVTKKSKSAKKKTASRPASALKAHQPVQPDEPTPDDGDEPLLNIKTRSITIEAKHFAIPTPPIEIMRVVNKRQWDYAITWCETQSAEKAYKAAGYSLATRDELYHQPMNTAGVRAAIDWLLSEITKSCVISVDWVKERLIRNYHEAMRPVPVLDRNGKFRGYERADITSSNRTLELAGKSIGMFQTQHNLTVGGEIRHLLIAVGSRGKPTLEQRREKLVSGSVVQTPKPGVIPDA